MTCHALSHEILERRQIYIKWQLQSFLRYTQTIKYTFYQKPSNIHSVKI